MNNLGGRTRNHLERAVAVALDLHKPVSLPTRGARCTCGALAALALDGSEALCERCFNAGRTLLATGHAQNAERIRVIDRQANALLTDSKKGSNR